MSFTVDSRTQSYWSARSEEDTRDDIRRALAGDQTGYDNLFKNYYTTVASIANRRLRNGNAGTIADVEDVAQEAFMKAFRALDKYDPVKPFVAWITSITNNTATDLIRKRGSRAAYELTEAELTEDQRLVFTEVPAVEGSTLLRDRRISSASSTAFESTIMYGQIKSMLEAQIPEREKPLFEMYREGHSYQEISEATGVPVGSCKSRVFRVRGSLAKQYEKMVSIAERTSISSPAKMSDNARDFNAA